MAEDRAESSETDVGHNMDLSSEAKVNVDKKVTRCQWYGDGLAMGRVTCPECKICRQLLSSKAGNTTNLFNHAFSTKKCTCHHTTKTATTVLQCNITLYEMHSKETTAE